VLGVTAKEAEKMAAFVTIVLGAACAFYCYALARFGREIGLLRSQRSRGATVIVRFRGTREMARFSKSKSKSKITVLPVGTANRDVA
jgi:hypothetical protein